MSRSGRFNDLNDIELREQLDEAKDDLFNLRFQSVIGQLDNHALVKESKKEVARLLTELRIREIEEAETLAGQAAGEPVESVAVPVTETTAKPAAAEADEPADESTDDSAQEAASEVAAEEAAADQDDQAEAESETVQ